MTRPQYVLAGLAWALAAWLFVVALSVFSGGAQ